MNAEERRPWWRKKRWWLACAVAVVILGGLMFARMQYSVMETRTYYIGNDLVLTRTILLLPPARSRSKAGQIMDILKGEPEPITGVQSFFQDKGIAFPRGAYATDDIVTQIMIVRNTKENLGKIEALINEFMPKRGSVHVIATLVEVTDPDLAGRFRDGTISGADIKNFGPDQVHVLDSISVLTTSDTQAQARNVSDLPFWRTSIDEGQIEHATIHEIGNMLNLTPVVGANGRTINLSVIWDRSRVVGWDKAGLPAVRMPMPIIRSQNFSTSVVLDDGETLAIQVGETTTDYLKPPGQEALEIRPQFLVLTARLIGTNGKPLFDRQATTKP